MEQTNILQAEQEPKPKVFEQPKKPNLYIPPGMQLIDVRVAAREAYSEAKKALTIAIFGFAGIIMTAALYGMSKNVIAIVFIGLILFFGVRRLQRMEYLNQKHNLGEKNFFSGFKKEEAQKWAAPTSNAPQAQTT